MPPKRGQPKMSSSKPGTKIMEMNHSYDEINEEDLPDIENQKDESHKWEERCETLNRNFHNYFCGCEKILIFFVFLVIIFGYINYIIQLKECRHNEEWCYNDKKDDHLLKENNNDNHRKLRVYGHYHHHRKTCDDYIYGCCEIYTGCQVNETSDIIQYKIHTIDRVIKKDVKGTNCPRLEDLVVQHNRHYPLPGDFNCETSKEGCYKVETECDIRVRFIDIEDGYLDDIELYKKNVNRGLKYTNLVERVGIDMKPTIISLIREYQNKYPSKDVDAAGMLIAMFSLLALVLCLNVGK